MRPPKWFWKNQILPLKHLKQCVIYQLFCIVYIYYIQQQSCRFPWLKAINYISLTNAHVPILLYPFKKIWHQFVLSEKPEIWKKIISYFEYHLVYNSLTEPFTVMDTVSKTVHCFQQYTYWWPDTIRWTKKILFHTSDSLPTYLSLR